jgi:hypothetical protein
VKVLRCRTEDDGEDEFNVWSWVENCEPEADQPPKPRAGGGGRGIGPDLRDAILTELADGPATSIQVAEHLAGRWAYRTLRSAVAELYGIGLLERDAVIHDYNHPPRYWLAAK